LQNISHLISLKLKSIINEWFKLIVI